MVGMGESAMVPQAVESHRAAHASNSVNWVLALLMVALLIGAVAGVVVALFSGMPTVALVIALVAGAAFAGVAC
ncbi:Transmembrane protein [Mycobacterium sp. smrl_JER01]